MDYVEERYGSEEIRKITVKKEDFYKRIEHYFKSKALKSAIEKALESFGIFADSDEYVYSANIDYNNISLPESFYNSSNYLMDIVRFLDKAPGGKIENIKKCNHDSVENMRAMSAIRWNNSQALMSANYAENAIFGMLKILITMLDDCNEHLIEVLDRNLDDEPIQLLALWIIHKWCPVYFHKHETLGSVK